MDYNKLGLIIIENFINQEEESLLVSNFKETKIKKISKGRNNIQRFGPNAPYKGNLISRTIPEYFNFILNRLEEQKLVDYKPTSITINEYHIGQGIAPHIDNNQSGDVITILSLLSDAIMVFSKKKENFNVELKSRSLCQMKDNIRYDWNHEIKPVTKKRYSIVFRC